MTTSSTSASVQDICSELLVNLDEDIREYIVGALEEAEFQSNDDEEQEHYEMVSSFLQSAGYLEDEDEAMEKARQVVSRVRAFKSKSKSKNNSTCTGTTADKDKDKDKPQELYMSEQVKRQMMVADADNNSSENNNTAETLDLHLLMFPKNSVNVNKNTLIDQDEVSDSLAKQAKKRDEKAAKKKIRDTKLGKLNAAEQAEADRMQLELELQQARIAAVLKRSQLGAYKGSLDAKSFTLPNPGGGQPLLEDAACRLDWGKRYGLIGRNGMGKSTLLRAFAARHVGQVPVNVTVHYVSQEVNLTADQAKKTPIECVVEADLERTLLLNECRDLEQQAAAGELNVEGSTRHGAVLARLEEINADSAHRRAQELLSNLGFSEAFQKRPLQELSGGWRVRTMLAAAIFAKPDMLLLDEPTNHLSILAVMWLARELSTSPTWKQRIVIIVSHDRHFMDEVCTDCLHISGAARRLTQCKGNYSFWAKRRKDEQALFAKEQAARQAEIDSLREYAGHGFKYGGSASQINKMVMKAKQADKLEQSQTEHAQELAALQEDMELPIKIASGGEVDGYLVQLVNVGFAYPSTTGQATMLFRNCEFGITSKSRIVLLGENGNGKTTLVKLIMGDLQPTEGEIKRSNGARFSLVNQHHADQIDLTLTPLEFLKKLFPGDGSYEHMQKLRGHLSSCGVTSGSSTAVAANSNIAGGGTKVKDLQNTPSSALSGGQRSRVALAAVSYTRPHVLVLDEPTNNLDLESVAALVESVQKFEGAVICVSHDQYFVQSVANEAWVVNNNKVTQVSSFEDYRASQFKLLAKETTS